jgi:glycosyltransferase involved in cell wall biosynthesis
MKQPLVSVIVTTKNNHETLGACLHSIISQRYSNLELIVVDNNSTDDTVAIARRYTKAVYTYGPERSAQRNFGVQKAQGEYVMIIDSDMELGVDVVRECVAQMLARTSEKAIIIPEESFGVGFWAECKALERSFYVGVDAIEAARFFERKLYMRIGGYNEAMTGGEDWDLTRRVRKVAAVGRVHEYIQHNEGRLYFGKTARKMYYYAQHAAAYFVANPTPSVVHDESGPLARYKLFFSKPHKLLKRPIISLGMLVLKTTEYVSAGFGYLQAKLTYRQSAGERG